MDYGSIDSVGEGGDGGEEGGASEEGGEGSISSMNSMQTFFVGSSVKPIPLWSLCLQVVHGITV